MTDKLASVVTDIAFTYDLPPKAVLDYAALIVLQCKDKDATLGLDDTRQLQRASTVLSKAYTENGLSAQGIRLRDIIKELFGRLRAANLIE